MSASYSNEFKIIWTQNSFPNKLALFIPGKSCTEQILNLTEFIEEGFEQGEIKGVTLVVLTAAYDTMNHKTLLSKSYSTLMDYKLAKIFKSLLSN